MTTKFVAYLLDSDTVAYGCGFLEIGNTREEAIAKLRKAYQDSANPDDTEEERPNWERDITDGEENLSWTDNYRLFVTEATE